MTLRGLVEHYRDRVRAHPVQEGFTGVGVAIGVALVFAVAVTNGSIATNARELVHAIAGRARLELVARSESGFDARVLRRVRGLPDVEAASPLLERRVALAGPEGRAAVELVGLDGSIAQLNGSVTRRLDPALLQVLRGGIMLPSSVAAVVGVDAQGGQRRGVSLELRGRLRRVDVSAVLGAAAIGPAADAAVAIAPLGRVQALTGLRDRLTRILVTPRPGRDAVVRRALARIAGDRITVAGVDREVALIAQAAAPSYQATGLFAAIAAICGTLLVFNAMLLTAPERRRSVAVLRVAAGYGRREIVAIVLFEALVLGIAASLAGIALGVVLARTVFAGAPSFLSFAFALGGHVAIPLTTVVLVALGGVLVTCLAAAPLLLDLRRARALDAVERHRGEAGQQLSARARRRLGGSALALLAASAVVPFLVPQATIPAIGLLVVATALAIPWLCAVAARLLQRLAERAGWHALSLACDGIRARTARTATLAATAAVAVCGCLAIEGAHRDVLRGLDRMFGEYLAGPDVWITSGRAENSLTTGSFAAAAVARRVRRLDGVRRVDPYYGGLLDVGDRRVWIIGRGAHDGSSIPTSQLVAGDLRTARTRLRSGGWIAVSNVLAAAQGSGVGGRFMLATPAGVRRYRVAAIVTNLGWGPGAVIMSSARYRRDWGNPDPTALQVVLRPGASVAATRRAVRQAIGAGAALRSQTTAEREAQFRTLARDGLEQLSQIAALLVVAAALSLAVGMTAATWQRRVSLAVLRLSGHLPAEVWRLLLLEAAIVLTIGCLTGILTGILGHALLGRWLTSTAGYPAPFALHPNELARLAGTVLGAALTLIAIGSARATIGQFSAPDDARSR